MSYPPPGDQLQPELADVFRLGRRLVRRTVAAARAEDQPLRRVLHDHLRPGAASMPTVSGSWLQYDHVNVQVGLDAWLARPGRQHELVGITASPASGIRCSAWANWSSRPTVASGYGVLTRWVARGRLRAYMGGAAATARSVLMQSRSR